MDKGNIRFGFGSPPNRGYDNKCASWGCSFEMGWKYGFRRDRKLERPYTFHPKYRIVSIFRLKNQRF